jgi:hypothetical protein
VVGISLGVAAASHGALVHRYSFNGNANDSVGGAHGAIVDAGDSNVNYIDGLLDVSSNAGYSPQDAYVSLPGPIINNAFTGGVEGEMTIEIWAQASVNRTWASLFSAGDLGGGIGNQAGYLQFIPSAAPFGGDPPFRITSYAGMTGPPEKFIDRAGQMSTTEPTHLVVAYHLTRIRTIPKRRYEGGFSVYINGALVGTVEYDSNLQLDQLVSNRTWLGRSQFDSDPIFDGAYDELRIYNSRLTAADVALNYQLGPNAIPEPSTVCLALMSLVGINYRCRRGG